MSPHPLFVEIVCTWANRLQEITIGSEYGWEAIGSIKALLGVFMRGVVLRWVFFFTYSCHIMH